nr:solute carrier family 25 member 44-like [Tanacetum cinerariifolium]
VNQSPSGIFINQSKYVHEILKKYGLNTYDIVGTPMDIKDKLDLDQIRTLVDATKYRSMIDALMYLTSSRPDIIHATCVCARYQAHPTEKHLKESDIFVIFTVSMEILLEPTSNKLLNYRQAKDHDIKFNCSYDIKSKIKILDYKHAEGTSKNSQDNKVLRLETTVDTESKLGPKVKQIYLYTHDLREPHLAALKCILQYVQGALFIYTQVYLRLLCLLGDNLLSCSAKRQHTLSRSSAEAKYRGVTNVVAETAWLRNLLRELHSPLSTATLVYCDSFSVVYMSFNHVQHPRTKHIEIDIHFVRDMVTAGQLISRFVVEIELIISFFGCFLKFDLRKVAKMSLGVAEDDSRTEIHLPADIDWEMLDKSKFFFLGAALFSGVSGTLYPTVVLKTRQQVVVKDTPCFKMAVSILRHDGFKGFYRGFGTSLMGTIPARALYMGALEMTKSSVGCATVNMGFSEAKAAELYHISSSFDRWINEL